MAKAPASKTAAKTATGAKRATASAKTTAKSAAKTGTNKAKAAKASAAATFAAMPGSDDWSARSAKFRADAQNFADQASARAKTMAEEGKTKAAGGLASLAKAIEENAATVDDKFGAQYGNYARSAARSVNDFADNLDSHNVDELVNQTRDFVKKSPAVAIGAAAVVGFVLARMLKGNDDA